MLVYSEHTKLLGVPGTAKHPADEMANTSCPACSTGPFCVPDHEQPSSTDVAIKPMWQRAPAQPRSKLAKLG
jgi:hypothetical protein